MIALNYWIGPLVRRSDPSAIRVWLATDNKIDPALSIYSFDTHTLARTGPVLSDSSYVELHLGARFWVYLMTARPLEGTFPSDRLLAYHVLEDKSRPTWNGFDIHANTNARRLPGHKDFSLILRSGPASNLRVLYGSCRKLHGPGPDAGEFIEKALVDNATNPYERPDVIFLGGDQIYADDVAPSVLTAAQRLGMDLLGYDEYLPGIESPASSIAPGKRMAVVRNYAAFRSDAADNHLLSLAEYVGMYVLAWNHQEFGTRVPRGTDPMLDSALDGTKALARAMANCPTYMMFDDHEITDDWFLNKQYRDESLSKPLGRRVIANGLAAFWLFQWWGNSPDGMNAGRREDIRRHFVNTENIRKDSNTAKAFEDAVLGFGDWSFVTPTRPAIIVPDCRTRRAVGKRGDAGPAKLIDRGLVQWLATQIATEAGKQGSPIAVVALNTPVWLPGPIANVQMADAAKGDLATNDVEGWVHDRDGYRELLGALLGTGQRQVFILAGDVHFPSYVRADLSSTRTDQAPTHRATIHQLVSSAMKNEVKSVWKRLSLERLAVTDDVLPDWARYTLDTRGWLSDFLDSEAADGTKEQLRVDGRWQPMELFGNQVTKWLLPHKILVASNVLQVTFHPTMPNGLVSARLHQQGRVFRVI